MDTELALPEVLQNILQTDPAKYQTWDLVELTQNYFKMLLHHLLECECEGSICVFNTEEHHELVHVSTIGASHAPPPTPTPLESHFCYDQAYMETRQLFRGGSWGSISCLGGLLCICN